MPQRIAEAERRNHAGDFSSAITAVLCFGAKLLIEK